MKRRFDQKFGKAFFDQIPAVPGVYRFLDAEGRVLYVGKAKNLRRRLGQYRNAKRLRRHKKMRTVVDAAQTLNWDCLATETEALLQETRLIQELRPRWNVAGAFSFLYPYLGICQNGAVTQIYLSHRPAEHLSQELFGCYRSRHFTLEAFEALNELLAFLAPRLPRKEKLAHAVQGPEGWIRPEKLGAFRGIHPDWRGHLERFFKTGDTTALEELVLELAGLPAARRASKRIQRHLNALKYFRKWEILPLAKAIQTLEHAEYPVAQTKRDPLFIRHRDHKLNKFTSKTQKIGSQADPRFLQTY